jgi:hypothetical protein
VRWHVCLFRSFEFHVRTETATLSTALVSFVLPSSFIWEEATNFR